MRDEDAARIVKLLEALHSGQQELRREHRENLEEARWVRTLLGTVVLLLALLVILVLAGLLVPGAQL